MLQIIENNMTPEQFAYWLQGFVEVHGKEPTKEQWQIIKDHLKEVFDKRTPIYTTSTSTSTPTQLGQSLTLPNIGSTFIC